MFSVSDLLSSHHRDDRCPVQGNVVQEGATSAFGDKPPVLRRCTVRWVAILAIVAIVYGTLFPFRVASASLWSWQLAWHSPAAGDSATNVLLYLPIGAMLRLIVRRRGTFWLGEFLFAVTGAAGLSYLTESLQTILVERVASWTDVCFNTVGAIGGAMLAPLAQRMIRNLHAWLFVELRLRPLAAAAALVTIAICAWGLMPLDLHPTPVHLAGAWREFLAAPWQLWWPGELAWSTLLAKWAACGGFAVLLWLLALGRRQEGDPIAVAVWHAWTRSAALAAVIEAVQLFTISHVADPRDLMSEWAVLFVSAALLWLVLKAFPLLHRRAGMLLRFLLLALAVSAFAWSSYSALHLSVSTEGSVAAWQPLAVGFHRPWASLLGEYTACLFRCSLLAIVLVLWRRSQAQQPTIAYVLLPVLGSVCLAQLAVFLLGHGVPDTVPWLIAVTGAILAVRLDRAFAPSPLG